MMSVQLETMDRMAEMQKQLRELQQRSQLQSQPVVTGDGGGCDASGLDGASGGKSKAGSSAGGGGGGGSSTHTALNGKGLRDAPITSQTSRAAQRL